MHGVACLDVGLLLSRALLAIVLALEARCAVGGRLHRINNALSASFAVRKTWLALAGHPDVSALGAAIRGAPLLQCLKRDFESPRLRYWFVALGFVSRNPVAKLHPRRGVGSSEAPRCRL